MGVVYKSISVTLPANAEKLDTILSVPDGKTYTIRSIGKTSNANYVFALTRDGVYDIEIPGDFEMGYSNFIPYNVIVEGPAEIKVGGTNLSGSALTVDVSIMYED